MQRTDGHRHRVDSQEKPVHGVRLGGDTLDEDQSAIKKEANIWKAKFFEKYPEADSNKDGQLSWQEHKKYKAKLESAKK